MITYRDEIPLTKTSLKNIVVSTFLKNDFDFKFLKFENRCYFFIREAKENGAFDTLKIIVQFRKRKIYCSMQSIIDSSLKNNIHIYDGLLNRQTYLINSSTESPISRENIFYYFENSILSVTKAMNQILSDFNNEWKKFSLQNETRFSDNRIQLGLDFINNLTIDKAILKQEFYDESAKAKSSIPENKHPIFCNLVSNLERIEQGKFKIENHMLAFELLHKYMFE